MGVGAAQMAITHGSFQDANRSLAGGGPSDQLWGPMRSFATGAVNATALRSEVSTPVELPDATPMAIAKAMAVVPMDVKSARGVMMSPLPFVGLVAGEPCGQAGIVSQATGSVAIGSPLPVIHDNETSLDSAGSGVGS